MAARYGATIVPFAGKAILSQLINLAQPLILITLLCTCTQWCNQSKVSEDM